MFIFYIRKENSQKIDINKFNILDIVNIFKHCSIKMLDLENKNINNKTLNNILKAISIFSGAGGDTLGLINSNVNVVGFVEFDEDAIKTHLENFKDSTLIGKDIRKIKNNDIKKYKDNIDIIFGGFPCQSFSRGGKKDPNDERGQLYKEFVRFINIIKPKLILGENVKGLLTRKNNDGGLFIDDILNDFKNIGYKLKHKLIKCKKFGVPQKRSRLFIIGINNEYMKQNNICIDITIPDGNNKNSTLRDICYFDLTNALKIEKQKFLEIIPEDKIISNIDDESLPLEKPPTNLLKCYNEEKTWIII